MRGAPTINVWKLTGMWVAVTRPHVSLIFIHSNWVGSPVKIKIQKKNFFVLNMNYTCGVQNTVKYKDNTDDN